MRPIIKMTVCSNCNMLLNVDWGNLNQNFDCPEQCEICSCLFLTEGRYIPAYDIELGIKELMIMVIRKAYGVKQNGSVAKSGKAAGS